MASRVFIFTWGSKFDRKAVHVDPVKCDDWANPLMMAYWVLGHAYLGPSARWGRDGGEPRRTDFVDVIGQNGVWEGHVAGQRFKIEDTLFDPSYEEAPKKKKRRSLHPMEMPVELHLQPMPIGEAPAHIGQAQVMNWGQAVQAAPAGQWVHYNGLFAAAAPADQAPVGYAVPADQAVPVPAWQGEPDLAQNLAAHQEAEQQVLNDDE